MFVGITVEKRTMFFFMNVMGVYQTVIDIKLLL